ncbi:MAG: MFS transporter [Dehalococcoidia bacterium]|nr:MFS transporter [Dehalococcoidia bacterium]
MQSSMEPAVAGPITDRQRLTLLAAAVAGHAFKHMLSAAFFVYLPEIKASLGLSNIQVGALSSLRNIAGGLTNLPAGFAADRFAQHRPVILGLSIALTGLFGLLLGLATNYGFAILASALMIVAITLWHPSAISWLSQQFAARRGLAISMHGAGGSLGEAVGPLAAGALLGVLSWRTVLQGSFVPAVAMGIGIWLILRSIPGSDSALSSVREYIGTAGRLLLNRRLLLVFLFVGGFAGGQSVTMTFLPIYLREDLGLSSMGLGLYLSLAQVAGVGTQPLMGYLSDRLGRKAVLVPGLAVLGFAYLGLNLAPPGWPLVVTVVVMGAFLFSLMSILLASAMDLVAREVQAITVSLVFGSAVVVSGFAPAVAGIIADAYGVKAAFLLAAGFVLTAALVAAVSRWQKEA